MSDQVLPYLMYEGRAEEAMRFYVSVFPGAEVLEILRYGKGAPGAEGTVSRAKFTVAGQTIMCADSTVKDAFSFSPATSLFVECTSRERMKLLVDRLSEGGKVFMPLDNYGFSTRFGWVGDPHGVTWQLNLA